MENFNKGYIEDIEWGKIQVNKTIYQHDVIINKGVVTQWDWRNFKTNHSEGIKVEELKAFLIDGEFDVDKIVLSRGMQTKLNISDETYLFSRIRNDVEFFVGDTISAYRKYNQWVRENNNVLAFFHLTC
jgi:hypothetical protein